MKMQNQAKRLFDTRTMIILAMITAIAFLLAWLIRFPVVPSVGFLRYDPKDIVIVIAGFMFGPLAAFMVTVVVSLIQMFTVSATGFIGFLMNVISGSAFAVTAAAVYSRRRTLNGAVIGLIAGTITMVGVMMLWNYIVTPGFMNVDREIVVSLLIPGFLPFNLFSGIVNSTLTMLLYKPLVSALKASNLMPTTDSKGSKVRPTGVVVVLSLFVLATAGLWTMAQQGIGPFRPYAVMVAGEGTSANHRVFPTHVTFHPVLDNLWPPDPDNDIRPRRAVRNEDTGLLEIEGFIGTVAYRIGSTTFYLNGEPITLAHAPTQNDRTVYMPIEFFSRLLGVDNVYYINGQLRIYNNTDD